MNRISIYETDPKALRDDLGTAEDLDAEEVGSGLMALCNIVAALNAKVEILEQELKKAKASNDEAAGVASMLANGMRPDTTNDD